MSHSLKLFCWSWCFLILTLCGCSSMVHAQACVGNNCVVPQPVRPIAREAKPYRPVLNVVIPRKIPADYDRFVYQLRTNESFRKTLCPVRHWYIDQMPDYARGLILDRGMPYFYFSDSTDAYVVGFDDPGEFLADVQAMRPEARAAAAAEKKRLQTQQEAQEAEEQARLDQEAEEEAKAAAEEAAEEERRQQAEAAERERLQKEEQQRLERDRDTEEIQSPDPSPRPAPTPPKPSIRDEIRQGVREGAKVAGKAAVKWAMPHIFEALGITPNVAAALAIVGGTGSVGMAAYAAYLAFLGLGKLRQKKTEHQQNKT